MIWVSWIQWGWIWLCFAIATWQDLQTYHVYDWIWLIMGIGATFLHFLAIYIVLLYSWLDIFVSVCITILFCSSLWGIGCLTKIRFLGTADYLALILFTYTIPSNIPLTPLEIFRHAEIFLLLNFMCNSTIIMILIAVGNFLRNIGSILKTPIKYRKMHWFGEFQNLSLASLCRLVLIGHRITISQLTSHTKAVSLEEFDISTRKWIPKGIPRILREDPDKTEQRWKYLLEITYKYNLQSIWIAFYIPVIGIFWISSFLTFLFNNWIRPILLL